MTYTCTLYVIRVLKVNVTYIVHTRKSKVYYIVYYTCYYNHILHYGYTILKMGVYVTPYTSLLFLSDSDLFLFVIKCTLTGKV